MRWRLFIEDFGPNIQSIAGVDNILAVSHDVTEHAEHTQIIINSAQEADNVILTLGPMHTILGWSNKNRQEYKDITFSCISHEVWA